MQPTIGQDPNKKIQERISREIQEEYARKTDSLKRRNDFRKEFDYFLEVLSLAANPIKFKERFNRPLAGLYCISTPLELFDAFGLHPLRLHCGLLPVHKLSFSFLPSTVCPAIKSCIGQFYADASLESLCEVMVIANSCYEKTKSLEIVKDRIRNLYVMQMPLDKESEKGQKRWLEEVYELKKKLEKYTGKHFSRKSLLKSIDKYNRAWELFGRLTEMKRSGLISEVWSIILANAFMLDDVDSWSDKVSGLIDDDKGKKSAQEPKVFLVGSPLFFPYLKIVELIEEVGMSVVADDLCTSERMFAGVVYKDPSEYGLLRAVAERYQLPCQCPIFPDNSCRVKNILEIMQKYNIKGVVFHLLKGCHIFDMATYWFERLIKENGFHFIKIETDYSPEDRENIITRLEAFKEMIY
ncbi:MAG: 2-hydroxyacyl-CoA dehydratase family protein [Candidatus Omnitrophica bacterium]|nr:2-hydroxyacyl-CoA dehydratase family protein [Candidatus Omnitrophota bacterium]